LDWQESYILSDTNSNPTQPRLLSFTLDDWNVLGGQVSVSLQNGVVVLVGRNGAGKSAILEGFKAISSLATGGSSRVPPTNNDSIPKILVVEILTPDDRRLEYRYELITLTEFTSNFDIDEDTINNSDENYFSWNDCCSYLDGHKEILWNTKNRVTAFNIKDEPILTILGSTSLFEKPPFLESQNLKLPNEMQWVYTALRRVHILGKTLTRPSYERSEALISVSRKRVSLKNYEILVYTLARKIWLLNERGGLYELENICQRVGLGNEIVILRFFSNGESGKNPEGEDYIFSVLLDGVNVGLLSDGTLRVLAILIEIIRTYPSMTIIIEEPETQIHPGMLEKLLNEIEAYTFDKNLILSTHSPQVVAWTSPENINLVHRKDGQTFVRKLGEDEIHNVIEYISDEGDLGEWIYSGILDE
jgi:energy-coupling factor transporter ATP-binding protein EcfA2